MGMAAARGSVCLSHHESDATPLSVSRNANTSRYSAGVVPPHNRRSIRGVRPAPPRLHWLMAARAKAAQQAFRISRN
jgi:hypothetical protein